MYDYYTWEETEAEKIERLRRTYSELGLSRFYESFAEYAQDVEDGQA